MKYFVFDNRIDGSRRELKIKEVVELIKKNEREFTSDKVFVFSEREWLSILDIILGIRLALPFIGRNALNPIAIITKKSGSKYDFMHTEYGEVRSYAEVLLTPGIEVYDSIEAINDSNKPKELSFEEYYSDFLPHIKVTSNEGSHSIANEWAAYNIGRLINKNNSEIPETKDLLYLCYLLVNGMNKEQLESLVKPSAESVCKTEIRQLSVDRDRKILLIDDQDDKWKNVIRELVTNNGSIKNITLDVWGKDALDIKFDNDTKTKVVSSIKIREKEDYRKEIIDKYDVLLLDMRLAGKDEQHQDTEKLSGIQVLKHILDEKEGGNPGQRVIIFTSSNKAWNIKRCLEIGAQSIFIKESPMYPLQENERIENVNTLLEAIQKGFESSWLKDVCRYSKKICNILYKKETDFCISIAEQIKIATEFFLKADKDDNEKMRLAFISLENVFELMSQEWVSYRGYNPRDKDDAKAIKEIQVSERVAELIEEYKIVSKVNEDMECCIKTLVKIRNKSIHKADIRPDYKWKLIVKKENDKTIQFKWRLSPKLEDSYWYIYMKDYVKSFRALMYLLYLIFVGNNSN